MDKSIANGLEELRESIKRMRSILAWDQLKRSEARMGDFSILTVYDHTRAELRNEYCLFTAKVEIVNTLISEAAINMPGENCSIFKQQLLELQREARNLDLPEQFYPENQSI